MKKSIIILTLFLFTVVYAREEVPLLIDTGAINVGYEEDNSSLIDVENMKKSTSVKRAKDELGQQQASKIKLDTRQIHHQRALDWTTKQNNSMLPIF